MSTETGDQIEWHCDLPFAIRIAGVSPFEKNRSQVKDQKPEAIQNSTEGNKEDILRMAEEKRVFKCTVAMYDPKTGTWIDDPSKLIEP